MRRSILLITTVLLSIATATALTIAAVTTAHPDVPTPSPRANTELVRHFYAAVNNAIATGMTDELDDVVAANFVEREPLPGLPPDRDGLKCHLLALHQTSPALRLEVSAITAKDDQVMARLIVRNAENVSFLGLPVSGHAPPWGQVDLFRVTGDRIVERWAAPDGIAVLRQWHESVIEVGPPTRRVLAVHRQTIPPNGMFVSSRTASRLVAVEAGRLATVDDAWSDPPLIAPATDVGVRRTEKHIDPGDTAVTGDLILVPEDTVYRAHNNSDEPTVVLTFDLTEPAIFGYTGPDPAPTTDKITTATILGGHLLADLAKGPHTVSIGRAALAPGAMLRFHDPPGPFFVVIESGTVDVVNGSDETLIGNGHDGITNLDGEARLPAGDGASLPAGSPTSIINTGTTPATLLVLSIRGEHPLPRR